MSKILVCQHVPHEILGILDPMFRARGFRIRYANFGRFPDLVPALDGYKGLVVLGGPMNVDEEGRYPHLTREIRLIEDALKKNIPVLGICLGSQLIAKALGAAVKPNGEKEIGWYDVKFNDAAQSDPLFRSFNVSEKIFQWHGYTFDIPAGAEHLAHSLTCTNQAFRYGDKVYGLQFHLEVDERLIERWLTVPMNLAELESLAGRIDPHVIRAQTRIQIERQMQLGAKAFDAFIDLFGKKSKFKRLLSR